MRLVAAAALLAAILAGCGGALAPGGDDVDGTGRKLLVQSFGPPYPAEPPPGRLVHIDRAIIDPAREVLTVGFTGANGYLASDGCSEEYTPSLRMTPEGLEVAIVEFEHIRVAFGACLGAGYLHTHHLTLPAPYDGVQVLDRGGGTFLIGIPDEGTNLAEMPTGWSVVHEEPGCCGTEPPVWVQVYAAAPVDEPPHEGPGRLVLYQAFGLSDEWDTWRAEKSEGRGGHPESVTMRGEPATVWVDEESGELLLGWDQDGRSYGLIGNLADMSVEELVRYAESLLVSSP